MSSTRFVTYILALFFSVSQALAGSIKISRDIDPKDQATDYTIVEADFRTQPSKFFKMDRSVKEIVVDIPYSLCTRYLFTNVDKDTTAVADLVMTEEFRVIKGKVTPCQAPPTTNEI